MMTRRRCCCAAVCSQTFTVTGCNNTALSGATVSVYDTEGGTLLASGTTASNGNVTLWWSGPCSVYVTAGPCEGYTNYGQSLALVQAATTTIALPPQVVGSTCCDNVYITPTLYVTDSNGILTITKSGSTWVPSSCLTVAVGSKANCVDMGGGLWNCVANGAGVLAYIYHASCTTNPSSGRFELLITRIWATYYDIPTASSYYADVVQCAPCTVCAQSAARSAVSFPLTQCSPVAYSGTPVFVTGNLPDPVGGPIAVSS